MEIVSAELWGRVHARKSKTRAAYMRTPAGTLLGKPEAGLMAPRCLLTGFLRCSTCGGGLAVMKKNGRKPGRYYCVERNRRGSSYCSNAKGIPVAALDRAVLGAINEALSDEGQVWDLITERVERWRREHERPKKERENIERQVKRIEAEIANLTRQAARGLDIDVREFNSRRSQVEELRRKLDAPAEIDLDRTALQAGLVMVRQFKGGVTLIDDPSKDYVEMQMDPVVGPLAVAQDPAGVRSALRKLGVERIVATPDETGWSFEGLCNLSRIITGVSAPSEPPPGLRGQSPRSKRVYSSLRRRSFRGSARL
jgi:hypothetical protein